MREPTPCFLVASESENRIAGPSALVRFTIIGIRVHVGKDAGRRREEGGGGGCVEAVRAMQCN